MNKKIVFLIVMGVLFTLVGLYHWTQTPDKIELLYLGIGTLISSIIYSLFYLKYKEVLIFIIGLLILHSGLVILVAEKISYPKLLGFIVFTSGIVVVLSSGFSDYLRKRKA